MNGPSVHEQLAEATSAESVRPSAGSVLIFRDPVPYSNALELQIRLHRERWLNLRPDTLLILEHQPVYTLGRSTQASHWGGNEEALRANGMEFHRVNRGGSVTYHGPGQIVVYPILRMAQHAPGPKQLVWLLEEVILQVLGLWKIEGFRVDKKPGIWIGPTVPAKIASIGIRVERGITMHGLALNVDMDLGPFRHIHPCGFADCPVTSMATLVKSAPSLSAIKLAFVQAFGTVFPLQWVMKHACQDIHVPVDQATHMPPSIM